MKTLIEHISEYLGLEKPLDIKIVSKKRGVTWCGDYRPDFNDEGELKKHLIRIYLNNISCSTNTRTFWGVVAHEMVHAWQQEAGIEDTKHHCKKFADMANMVKERFSLGDVFIPDVDVT